MNPMLDTPPTGTKVAAVPNPIFSAVKAVLKPFASLQLTVALFALAIVLVFFGTLAQIDNGIWQVVDQYFWSYSVNIKFNLISQFAKVFLPGLKIGTLAGSFPFPAGKTIGGLMLFNLLAAHLVRFKLSWKRSGIILIHSGVALMLVGEWITRERAVEQRMSIDKGAGVNYAEDTRNYELAITDVTDPEDQTVAVVPFSLLKSGAAIRNDVLPVEIDVVQSFPNAKMTKRKPTDDSPADRGFGNAWRVEARDIVSGVDPNQKMDVPAAYVTLRSKHGGKTIGTFLVGLELALNGLTEPFAVDGRKYELSLRMKRHYKPFTVFLTEFRFDRYLGTNTPKNYSSDVVLLDPEQGSERAAHISMNDPLRYGGEAFYQSGFDERTEATTYLQVVKNPGWLIPYLSCIVVGLGMLVHFGITLPKKAAAAMRAEVRIDRTKWDRYAPWASLGFVGVVLLGAAAPLFVRPKPSAFDLTACGALPVVDGGRLKPLDTPARTALRIVAAKESLDDGESRVQAIAWYLETISRREPSFKLQTVRIDNEQLLNELKLKVRDGFRYSIEELLPSAQIISARASAAKEKKDRNKDLDTTEQKFLELGERIRQVMVFQQRSSPLVVPPTAPGGKWESFETGYERLAAAAEDAVWEKVGTPPQDTSQWPRDKQTIFEKVLADELRTRLEAEPALKAWWEIAAFYRNQKPAEFNAAVAKARELADAALTPGERTRVAVETVYNRVGPFFWAIGLYVFGFVLSTIAVLGSAWARKSALRVVGITFVLHTLALLTRMYLQGRPPVTNLYSSAVFIGWGCVGLGMLLERAFKGGYAIYAGSVLGFLTTLMAHNLDKGDSLEMLQAVLDTNFWLATHVVCITLGYVATAFAGILGIAYVVRSVFFPDFNKDQEKTLSTLTYIVLCLATLLSFVGTVLGGIWADQSWGRFWGWDPKENGAVLIVLWNVLVLHARWAGLVKSRGVAVLTIFGNVITMWSWFGTNQLGQGLHAYGFSNELATWCTVVWGVHLAFVAVGLVPRQMWASTPTANAEPARGRA